MFLVFGIALLAGTSYAEDFSADMVSSSPDGIFTAKIYVSGQKSRMEMSEATTISRMDKMVAWVIMPSELMYMEQPIDARSAAGTQEKVAGEIERIVEGKETVNGMATIKYRVTFQAQGRRETVFQWIDDSTHIPVKTAAIDGSWSSEFKNIQTGAQDQGLFEIPAGYQKMSLGMPDMSDMLTDMGD
jgi:hypothetical protein